MMQSDVTEELQFSLSLNVPLRQRRHSNLPVNLYFFKKKISLVEYNLKLIYKFDGIFCEYFESINDGKSSRDEEGKHVPLGQACYCTIITIFSILFNEKAKKRQREKFIISRCCNSSKRRNLQQ